MSYSPAVVFWSYSHEDDRLDGGRILDLATRLANEYSFLTGHELTLFVDQSIIWGEEWRKRIDDALVTSAFFIPIMTPRYFTRSECRLEVTTFHGKAAGAGVKELLLPILYAGVPNLISGSDDTVVALLSRYQYEDWTSLRLEDVNSNAFRKSLNSLARRLADANEAVMNKQLTREVAVVQGRPTDEPGLGELADTLNVLVPSLLDAVEANRVGTAQHDAVWEIYKPRLEKLEKNPGQAGAKFAVLQRLAVEEGPLAERLLREAATYAKLTLNMQPLFERLWPLLEKYPEEASSFEPCWTMLKTVGERIYYSRTMDRMHGVSPASIFWERRAHFSQLASQLAKTYAAAEQQIDEINLIVEPWVVKAARLQALPPDNIIQSSEAE